MCELFIENWEWFYKNLGGFILFQGTFGFCTILHNVTFESPIRRVGSPLSLQSLHKDSDCPCALIGSAANDCTSTLVSKCTDWLNFNFTIIFYIATADLRCRYVEDFSLSIFPKRFERFLEMPTIICPVDPIKLGHKTT